MLRNVSIMGVRFVDQPIWAAIAQLRAAVADRHKRTLFFANASTLNLACDDPAYRETLNGASFVYGDGTGVRWAAKLRGVTLQDNLNGTDVIPELLRTTPGLRVYMIGSSGEQIARAAKRFPTLFPDAKLVGWRDGYFDHDDCGEVIDAINATKPDLLLVGFGNPLQERWITANRERIAAPLAAGVGGLFDFWSGKRRRASRLMRAWGMEWLHILFTERHMARRYLIGNPVFLVRMVWWLRADRERAVPAPLPQDGVPCE